MRCQLRPEVAPAGRQTRNRASADTRLALRSRNTRIPACKIARLNETDQPSKERPRFSLLPDEAAEDAVVYTLDWLKEAVQTPEGLEQAYTYVTATINERDRLLEQI